MEKAKVYCYVDETGQDTYGKFFLVLVVLLEQLQKETLESIIEDTEQRTKKHKVKWKNTIINVKREFLQEIVKIKELKQTLFYSVYRDTKKYNYLTALTVSKVVNTVIEDDYFVSVIIDGLSKKDTEKMKVDLKGLGIKYKNIRGMKDEQSAFLRLADAMAGFVRDYLEGEAYTKDFYRDLKVRGFIEEV